MVGVPDREWGERVVAVVADSRALAEDAAEKVEIEYEPETVPRNQSPILLMYSASRPRERP